MEKRPSICTEIIVRTECLSTSRASALYIRNAFSIVIIISRMGKKYKNSWVLNNNTTRTIKIKTRKTG
jgi:hypothetical protein